MNGILCCSQPPKFNEERLEYLLLKERNDFAKSMIKDRPSWLEQTNPAKLTCLADIQLHISILARLDKISRVVFFY